MKIKWRLTIDIQLNSFAHSWWDPIGGDAHVGPHLAPGHLVQLDLLSVHLLSWNGIRARTVRIKIYFPSYIWFYLLPFSLLSSLLLVSSMLLEVWKYTFYWVKTCFQFWYQFTFIMPILWMDFCFVKVPLKLKWVKSIS